MTSAAFLCPVESDATVGGSFSVLALLIRRTSVSFPRVESHQHDGSGRSDARPAGLEPGVEILECSESDEVLLSAVMLFTLFSMYSRESPRDVRLCKAADSFRFLIKSLLGV